MESSLDEIAGGDAEQVKTLRDFYENFEPLLNKAYDGMEKIAPKLAGEDCPECGHPLVHRQSRYGEFIGCSNYPECRYIKPKEAQEIKEICDCPKCTGKIIEKRTRRGKIFYACNNYPECDYASWDKPTGKKCPDCSEMLVEKKGVIKCSACEYEENFESSED
jgi:DNA topoisomerase-1